MSVVHLRRIDPTRNMRRFYRLDVQPDLFGGVLLVKEWGRIGARGRTVAERYDSEALCRRRLAARRVKVLADGTASQADLARRFNVSQSTISRLRA
jgi:predicted DNA-binding WGR domain protein